MGHLDLEPIGRRPAESVYIRRAASAYMADPSAKEAATLSKSVQEMSINGSEPPEEYTVKDGSFGSIESSPPLGSIPIINISLFLPSSSHDDTKQVENELQKLRSALSSGGCFQVMTSTPSFNFSGKIFTYKTIARNLMRIFAGWN